MDNKGDSLEVTRRIKGALSRLEKEGNTRLEGNGWVGYKKIGDKYFNWTQDIGVGLEVSYKHVVRHITDHSLETGNFFSTSSIRML